MSKIELNKNLKFKNIFTQNKKIHQYPWFLVGAYISTISTVYIYFNNRNLCYLANSDSNIDTNSFEQLDI
jgi:hypothetical protein